jgi:predicted NAD/FAD-dependent oxidoreductase
MARSGELQSCLVVGAGIAGLLAARTLADSGIEVVVLDKARGAGGRMATRWVDRDAGAPETARAVWDHGAQFFTARDEVFRAWADEWLKVGVTRIWAGGFPGTMGDASPEGHPRYRGTDGMSAIAKHLSRGIDVRLKERVVAVGEDGGRSRVRLERGTELRGDALILTPPVPQSLALLDAGGVRLPEDVRSSLERITYAPCIAILAEIDGASRVPAPGGMRLAGEPIAWIADNRQKGISPEATTITIHAGPEFSHAHWDDDPDGVARMLLDAAGEWIGDEIRSWQVHRWRYSQPVDLHPERCLIVSGPPLLAFAGDAFGGPRVEGAALSGLATAGTLISPRAQEGKSHRR